jgi:hypothetical protein
VQLAHPHREPGLRCLNCSGRHRLGSRASWPARASTPTPGRTISGRTWMAGTLPAPCVSVAALPGPGLRRAPQAHSLDQARSLAALAPVLPSPQLAARALEITRSAAPHEMASALTPWLRYCPLTSSRPYPTHCAAS